MNQIGPTVSKQIFYREKDEQPDSPSYKPRGYKNVTSHNSNCDFWKVYETCDFSKPMGLRYPSHYIQNYCIFLAIFA